MKKKIIGILIVGALLGVTAAAFYGGYIPWNLEVKEPMDAVEIQVDMKNLEESDSLYQISQIPNLDKFKYQIYDADSSIEEIQNQYDTQLADEGYLKEPDYSGVIYHDGRVLYYSSYIKGITAVVVVMTPKDCCSSYVLYTTGAVYDYLELADWLRGMTD